MKKTKLHAKLFSLLEDKQELFKRIKEVRNEIEALKDGEIANRRKAMKDNVLKASILLLNGATLNSVAKKFNVNPGSLHHNIFDLLGRKNPVVYDALQLKAREEGYWFPLLKDMRQKKHEFLKFLQ